MSRTKLSKILVGAALCGLLIGAAALHAAESTSEVVGTHVRALTAPETEGRGNRTEGIDVARDYIVEEMKRAGLEPAGAEGFAQPVDVVVDAEPSRNLELRVGGEVLASGHQYTVAGFSGDDDFQGAVVFAGYGISAPHLGWDDYAELDVRGDVVVVLTGAPGSEQLDLDAPTEEHLDTPQAKAAVALAMGAAAVIVVNDPEDYGDSPNQRPDVLPEFWPAPKLDGISAAFATARASEEILGPDFIARRKKLQTSPDQARGPLGMKASGNLELIREKKTLYNLVGQLPGSPESGEPLVIGAHYDGLGLGEPGSLVDDEAGVQQVHPGADDNASGVAVLLAVAETLAGEDTEWDHPVLFAALVSEELGMRGSRVLAAQLRYDDPPGTMINMDMVGRMKDQSLHVALGESAGPLSHAIESAAAENDLSLQLERLRERRSDHISFAEAGFDAASLSTGRHVDYHMPSDTPDQLRPEGMVAVHDFLADVIRRLASE